MVYGAKGLFLATALAFSFGIANLSALAETQYRAGDVETAVQNLYNEDPEARRGAVNTITEMGPQAKAAVPKLIEILQTDPSMSTRGEAAKALGNIGAPAKSAVPALIVFLKGQEGGYERCYAATALGDIKELPETAVPVLNDTLSNKGEDPTVRQLAARSLGNFGAAATKTVPQLVDAAKTGPKELRDAACDALQTIPAGPSDLPSLVELLNDEVDLVRIAASRSIGLAGPEGLAAVPALVKLLDDPSIKVQQAAIIGLGGIGPNAKNALPALKKSLRVPELHSPAFQAIEDIKASK